MVTHHFVHRTPGKQTTSGCDQSRDRIVSKIKSKCHFGPFRSSTCHFRSSRATTNKNCQHLCGLETEKFISSKSKSSPMSSKYSRAPTVQEPKKMTCSAVLSYFLKLHCLTSPTENLKNSYPNRPKTIQPKLKRT